jgi:hypothetical protein
MKELISLSVLALEVILLIKFPGLFVFLLFLPAIILLGVWIYLKLNPNPRKEHMRRKQNYLPRM